MKDIYQFKKKFIFIFGITGWLFWVYVFWYILLIPNPRGYYLNPFKKYNEFRIEFFAINIIFFLMIIFILLEVKSK